MLLEVPSHKLRFLSPPHMIIPYISLTANPTHIKNSLIWQGMPLPRKKSDRKKKKKKKLHDFVYVK